MHFGTMHAPEERRESFADIWLEGDPRQVPEIQSDGTSIIWPCEWNDAGVDEWRRLKNLVRPKSVFAIKMTIKAKAAPQASVDC